MCIRDRVSTQSTWGEETKIQLLSDTKMIGLPVTFGYWGVRGRVEHLKLLAEYLHIPYNFRAYTTMDEWQIDKGKLLHPFPNLPYLKDGEKHICESDSIAYYLAYKANRSDLLGRTQVPLPPCAINFLGPNCQCEDGPRSR
eukprot:TRINITY_DN4463_c0_g1_i1.p1 TRINITY_DN4463_c0_g1~~TRINITY_DN4463_c0_g1_i1.p1  ORF type:complete len:161 (-),score=37.94 TRINITY_DN4463_c0_g1_i1:351-773(-)